MCKCKLGIISQEMLIIEVKFLLSANRMAYVALIGTTTDELEWPFPYCVLCLQ